MRTTIERLELARIVTGLVRDLCLYAFGAWMFFRVLACMDDFHRLAERVCR